MASIDRAWFVPVAMITWVYVIVRAALVPWVHDESASLYWFLERGEYLPYRSLWDAGNHFLSSAIGAWGHKLWGLSLLGSRMGSVLAFPLYAWAAFRIGGAVRDTVVRRSMLVALILCPFVLDFFAVFRGYGLALAFLLVAVDGALRYWRSASLGSMSQMLIGLLLADLAVLTLVPLWAMAVGATGLHVARQGWQLRRFPMGPAIVWVVTGALPLALGILLAWELKRRGLLYHGSLEGFVQVTLASLARYTLGSDNPIVLAALASTVLFAVIVVLARWRVAGAVSLLAVAVVAEVMMRSSMAWLLDVNYPEDRAALHLVPLSILLLAAAVDHLAGRTPWVRWCALVLWVLPLRAVLTANVDHTLLWPEQSVPTRFLHQVAQAQGTRPATLGTYHQLSLAVPYTARLHGITVGLPDTHDFPHTPTDHRIVDDRFLAEALHGYRVVDHAPGPGLYLLQREQPLRFSPLGPLVRITGGEGREFMELWRNDTTAVQEDLWFDLRTSLRSDAAFLDLHLVMEQKRAGESLHYQTWRLALLAPQWQGGPLHQMVRMPQVPDADERVLYIWSPQRQAYSLGEGTLQMLRLVDPSP